VRLKGVLCGVALPVERDEDPGEFALWGGPMLVLMVSGVTLWGFGPGTPILLDVDPDDVAIKRCGRSGVGLVGDVSVDEVSEPDDIKLFMSERAGARSPGSSAVKALTAGYTIVPIDLWSDCWYLHVWFCFGWPQSLHLYRILGWSAPPGDVSFLSLSF